MLGKNQNGARAAIATLRGGRTALTFAANYFWDQIKRSTKGAWFCHVCYSMYMYFRGMYLCTYVHVF